MLAKVLAQAISDLRYEDLRPDVVHGARRSLLDTLGAILVGVDTEEVTAVCRAVTEWGSAGSHRVWGTDRCFSAPDATLINGTAAHAREVDDFGGCGHSGAVVIPAVLAAAQSAPCSGKRLLTAIVAGYEVAVRVTDAVGGYRQHNAQGWHSTGTTGVFGAVAAAGHALRLDAQQMSWALGLAGTYTGGIWAFIVDGAMSKRLHAGKAAQSGLVAALLARSGFTGPTALFEDTWGSFLNTYAPDTSTSDVLVRDLDQDWQGIFRSGFKPYACCRGIHSTLDAVFALKGEHNIHAADINKVVVTGSYQTKRQLGKADVETILDAQFSIPYSIALALVIGRAGLEEYEEKYRGDSRLADFARKVEVVADDRSIEAQPTVELQLVDGRCLAETVQIAKGDNRNPMSDRELEGKFLSLASRTLPLENLDRIVDNVWCLEDIDDTKLLFNNLIPIST